MSPRWLLTVALFLSLGSLCALGCGSRRDPAIDMLERENRALEDLIWRWKDAYDEKVQDLEACQRAYRSQRRLDEADELPNPTMQPSPVRPKPVPAPANPAGAARPPRSRPADPLGVPVIEGPLEIPVPESSAPTRTTRQGGLRPAGGEEDVEPTGPIVVRAGGEEPVAEVDAEVTHIVLNQRLTGGFDFDKAKTGDEGVTVVIEPRNGDGAYVPLSGELTVVLLDPAEEGEAQRIARFDFDAIEASRHLRKSLLGKGIHLDLRWPDQPPHHEIVRIAVRYTTPEGRKLEARRDVKIVLPIEAGGRWTPVGGSPVMSPREEITTAGLPAENRPAAASPAEPALIQLPLPKTEWKPVEGR